MPFAMTEEQRYLFDLNGYIVVPDVLDENQVQTLRDSVKCSADTESKEPLHWHSLWRDLLDWPSLTPIMEELIGNPVLLSGRESRSREARQTLPTFRLDHINVHTHVKNGFPGGPLHGGWNSVAGFYRYDNGVFYNGMTTVTFELFDTQANDGGFACVPGSHKSNLLLPGKWVDLSASVADCVTRVSAKPGDAIIFTEALTHGTLPWKAESPRLTIFYKYSPHSVTWSSDYYDPDDFRCYDDMDDRKLAILEPPNARHPTRSSRPARIE